MAKMQSKNSSTSKRIAIVALMTVAVLITVLGLAFSVYSFFNNVTYQVLNTGIPGWVFGLVVAFLGSRYIRSTYKFAKKLFKAQGSFHWSNFRISKSDKRGWSTK